VLKERVKRRQANPEKSAQGPGENTLGTVWNDRRVDVKQGEWLCMRTRIAQRGYTWMGRRVGRCTVNEVDGRSTLAEKREKREPYVNAGLNASAHIEDLERIVVRSELGRERDEHRSGNVLHVHKVTELLSRAKDLDLAIAQGRI
jgi:hypothetical protein